MQKIFKIFLMLLLGTVSLQSMEKQKKNYLAKILELIQKGDAERLEGFLLSKKKHTQDINDKDSLGCQPIHHAVNLGNLAAVLVLKQFGADVNSQIEDEQGDRPLHLAAYNGNAKLFARLMQVGADIKLKNNLGQKPVKCTRKKAIIELVKKCLMLRKNKKKNTLQKRNQENKSSISEEDSNNWFRGIRNQNIRGIERLLSYGVDVNLQDENRETALIRAAFAGWKEGIDLLLTHHADVNMQDQWGDTPLMKAACHARKKALKLLLAYGADVDLQDKDGWSALMKAAAVGHKELVKPLLAYGTDINMQDKNSCTALQLATNARHKKIVSLLSKAENQPEKLPEKAGKKNMAEAQKNEHGCAHAMDLKKEKEEIQKKQEKEKEKEKEREHEVIDETDATGDTQLMGLKPALRFSNGCVTKPKKLAKKIDRIVCLIEDCQETELRDIIKKLLRFIKIKKLSEKIGFIEMLPDFMKDKTKYHRSLTVLNNGELETMSTYEVMESLERIGKCKLKKIRELADYANNFFEIANGKEYYHMLDTFVKKYFLDKQCNVDDSIIKKIARRARFIKNEPELNKQFCFLNRESGKLFNRSTAAALANVAGWLKIVSAREKAIQIIREESRSFEERHQPANRTSNNGASCILC